MRRRAVLMLVACALGAGLPAIEAAALPGDLDLPFGGGDGRVEFDSGMVPQPLHFLDLVHQADGRALVHGLHGSGPSAGVMRYLVDGTPDLTWNGGQPVPIPRRSPSPDASENGQFLQVDAAGRLVAKSGTRVLRFTTSGVPDTAFSGDGVLDLAAHKGLATAVFKVDAIRVLSSGKLLVALGEHDDLQDVSAVTLVRLNATGTLDTTFAGDGSVRVTMPVDVGHEFIVDLQVDATGSAFFSAAGFSNVSTLGKVSAAGVPEAAFGGDGMVASIVYVDRLLLDTAGRPVLLGSGTHTGQILARHSPTSGAPDTTLGPGGTAPAPFSLQPRDVAASGDTVYVISGWSDRAEVGAYTLDGSLVPGFVPSSHQLPGNPQTGGLVIARTASGDLRAGLVESPPFGELTKHAALLGLTPSGAVDESYGADGFVTVGVEAPGSAQVTATSVAPDGDLLAAGDIDAGLGGAFVVRTDAGGTPDPDFGDGGRVALPAGSRERRTGTDVEALADGRVVVLTHRTNPPSSGTGSRSLVTLLDAEGAPDPSFDGDGTAEVVLAGFPFGQPQAADLTIAGSGAGLAALVVAPGESGMAILRIPLATGTQDPTYGAADGTDDGQATFAASHPFGPAVQLAGAADGSVLWAARRTHTDPDFGDGLTVGRFGADGAATTSFGDAGRLDVPAGAHGGALQNAMDTPVRLQRRADGGADVLAERSYGMESTAPMAARVTPGGALDAAYGDDGIALMPLILQLEVVDGSVVGDRATFTSLLPNRRVHLARYTPSGAPDASIGTDGARTSAYVTPASAPLPTRGIVQLTGVVVGTVLPLGVGLGAAPQLLKLTTEGPKPPTEPTDVQATTTPNTARVSWTAPASTGGSPITSYLVTSSPHGRTCTAAAPATSCQVEQLTNSIAYTFTVTATNAAGVSPPSAASAPVTPTAGYFSLSVPRRLVDSRPTGATLDGQDQGFGQLQPGQPRTIQVRDRLGFAFPGDSAVLNITAIDPAASGHLTVYPCGSVPSASSLNFTTGVTIANMAVTRLTAGGEVCVTTSTRTHVVIDVSGVLTTTAFPSLPTPQRLADSRLGRSTSDGQQQGFGRMAGGSTRTIPIAGRVGLPGNAASVVLTIAAVNPSGEGYLTIFPCGTRPTTSSMNVTKGVTIASTLLARLSAGGAVCVHTSTTIDLVVDTSGPMTIGNFLPLSSPKRVADSRPGRHTDDGQAQGFGRMAAGSTLVLPIAGRVGVPTGPITGGGALVVTLVAINPSATGHITTYFCGASGRPATSTLNYRRGTTIATTTIQQTSINPSGRICIYTSAATDLVVDVSGTVR